MRYLILKPREAEYDPRHVAIRDPAHLHDLVPPIADCSTEKEAVDTVRKSYPHVMGMPFTVKVGGSVQVLLGFIEDPRHPVDVDDDVPFVLFVQAVPEDRSDRKLVELALKGEEPLFDKKLWALKPVCPDLGKKIEIEWRTSENDSPVYLDGMFGYENGRLVLFAEMGQQSMSICFPDGWTLTNQKKEENDRIADLADAMSY